MTSCPSSTGTSSGVIVGFTGTRTGLSCEQQSALKYLLMGMNVNGIYAAHHGDCVGADSLFHKTLRELDPSIWVVGHPPKNPKYRAFCDFDEMMPEDEYLIRNEAIVKASDLMIACPMGFTEEFKGSGTWATIRMSKELDKKLIIIYPDGSLGGES